jgi:hypothetical protein
MLAQPDHEECLLIFVTRYRTSFQKYWWLEQAFTYIKILRKRFSDVKVDISLWERPPTK